jgi:HlyD family secretion protein
MKRAIPIVILLAAAVAAGLYYYPRLTRKSAPANQLSLSGNIEAHESLVGFKVAGRIVDLPVEEGQQVQQGALLARLDDADYQQKVRIDQAAMGVRSSDLALTLAGTRQQEVKAAQQTMIDAQADLDQKNLDNQRARQLFAKDELSAQERDLAATALKRSQAIFQAAEQRYNEAVEGSRKEDIAIARANLNAASADLGLSQVNLGYTVLRAPSAGVVTVRQAELGEVVSSGCAPTSPKPTWAAFAGVKLPPSPPTPTPAGSTTGASPSFHPAPSSRPRACRLTRSGSRSSIASKSTSTTSTTN